MAGSGVRAVPRDWGKSFPIVARAEGIYLYDEAGRRYIDGSGGSSVCTSIGHAVAEVPLAMHEQAKNVSYAPTHAFTCASVLELADRMVEAAPGELRNNSRVWFSCTGTDSTDDAVRLARQYWVEAGKPSKYQVICRWQAFHGNSIAVAGFSGITARRRLFQPMFIDSPHIPPAYCYRCPFEKSLPGCGLLCARALETAIRQQGPENVAAFIVEPVVGAALAAVPAPDGYLQAVREICDAYDVLLIDDEVMTGWGRTGKRWGIEHWGVTPDIIATAKGLTSGYIPLAAIIARESIWSLLEEHRAPFMAGHTLNANAVACAASIAVLEYMETNRLTENAARRGEQALAGLRSMMESHPIIGRVSGLGLMLGVEFVRDRTSRAPFAPSENLSSRVEQEALKRGLVVFPCYGCVDGVEGNMVMVAPPLTISEPQMDELLQILDASIAQVEQDLGVAGVTAR